MRRRRKNPIDALRLRDMGAPVACAVALHELTERGADVKIIGGVVVVDGIDAGEARATERACGIPVIAAVGDESDRALRRAILDEVAKVAFADAWHTRRNYALEDGKKDPGRFPPKRIPKAARAHAAFLVDLFEARNHMPVGMAFRVAARQPSAVAQDPTPEEFGYYLYMESIGSGVSWEDDHPPHGFEIPSVEGFYL